MKLRVTMLSGRQFAVDFKVDDDKTPSQMSELFFDKLIIPMDKDGMIHLEQHIFPLGQVELMTFENND